MSFFYNLGRRLGYAAVPGIRRARWIWSSLTASDEEALRAENALGAALATELRATAGPVDQPHALPLLRALALRLAAHCPSHRRTFQLELIQTNPANAIALPGGFIFLSLSLVDLCGRDPDELAFVIAHEMSHVILGHAWNRLLNETALKAAALVAGRAGPLGGWVRHRGLQVLQSAHARQGEFEADAYGLRLVGQAGFEPAGAFRLLQRLSPFDPDPSTLGPYLASHPPAAERLTRLRDQAGKPA
jgi:beta-barrel assembly-enhancing protease